jgi:flagellar protein FliJ
MTRRFRLATVLRARQAQEKVAKAAVLRARAAAAAATERHAEQESALAARPTVDGGAATWYVAALAARQALAGEVSAAAGLAERTAEQLAEQTTELIDAAIRRRSMETLADRHAAAVQEAELAAGQRVLDEVATNRRPTGRTQP